jgi:hypothetical protein
MRSAARPKPPPWRVISARASPHGDESPIVAQGKRRRQPRIIGAQDGNARGRRAGRVGKRAQKKGAVDLSAFHGTQGRRIVNLLALFIRKHVLKVQELH